MNANLFPKPFFRRGFFTEANVPGIEYASAVEQKAKRLAAPALDYGPTIAHNRRLVSERSFTNASAPIFERDFPKYGVAPIERADIWANTPWPSEIPTASDAQILALGEGKPVDLSKPEAPSYPLGPVNTDNQWVFPLGGFPKAFLRVQYHVLPVVNHDIDKGRDTQSIWGRVLPGESEYLIQHGEGTFMVIAEWPTWAEIPLPLRRIEESGRPDHIKLGWTEDELLDLAGENGECASHE